MARFPFDPDHKEFWGWWWNPDIDREMQLEDNGFRPEWVDDEPWDEDMMRAWYEDAGLPQPRRPGAPAPAPPAAAPPAQPATQEPAPETKPASSSRRARPGANVANGTVKETRDAGRRKRRMKRYMKWWHAREAARAQGLPEPARPIGGFGDPPDWQPSQEDDDDTVH